MSLKVTRQDKLTGLFDKFATLPDDLDDKNKKEKNEKSNAPKDEKQTKKD